MTLFPRLFTEKRGKHVQQHCVDVKQDLWQLVQSHPAQERVCLASSVDWTTNGMVKPVVESGTVWIAFALGGVVAGDDVRCCMDVWLDGIRSKMCAEADHSWYWGNATHGTRRDVGTRGCWLVWACTWTRTVWNP